MLVGSHADYAACSGDGLFVFGRGRAKPKPVAAVVALAGGRGLTCARVVGVADSGVIHITSALE